MKRTATALLLGVLWVTSAHAQVVISCGASEGRGYYVEGGAVPPGKGGWHDDNITGGRLDVTKQGTEYDVQFQDAQGSFSARQNGHATILPLANTPDRLVILVIYPAGATEVYEFRPINHEVVWAQVKYAGAVDKASVYHARCN